MTNGEGLDLDASLQSCFTEQINCLTSIEVLIMIYLIQLAVYEPHPWLNREQRPPENHDSQCPPRLARNKTKYLQISKQVITKPPE